MKAGSLVALLTTGCFSVLACYSIGAFHPDAKPEVSEADAFVAQKLEAYSPRGNEVTLWKSTVSVDEIQKARAAGLGVVDRIALTGEQKRKECGEDYVCLLAWLNEERGASSGK